MELKIGVVGLGYVGLPLAVALEKHFTVVGFDVSKERISQLEMDHDSRNEVSKEELEKSRILLSSNPLFLKECDFVIICVPTPIDEHKNPDLAFLRSASKLVGENLKQDALVVYESTVYPGATQEECVPVLEKYSRKKCGIDFKVGYSPERMNPGDTQRSVDKIVKIVAGMDEESLAVMDFVYSKITKTYCATSIKVAEAAKVIENIQRDLNIALMNELSLIFDRAGIKTKEVLEAAGTKWNFHHYTPGLVGGHCIGVDPYYLTHKAIELGYTPEVILAGRKINDSMYRHVVDLVVRNLNESGKVLRNSKIAILGLTFKENVHDFRNSKAQEVIEELKSYGMSVHGCDPLLGAEIVEQHFNVPFVDVDSLQDFDGLVVIAPHDVFQHLNFMKISTQMASRPFMIDVKGKFEGKHLLNQGFIYRSL